jgi:hypothetical protein
MSATPTDADVEAVARAMCRSELMPVGQAEMDAGKKPCRWPTDFADAKGWRNLARAALAALRARREAL